MDREVIKAALEAILTDDFLEKSKDLLATIGYRSERTLDLTGTVQEFFNEFPAQNQNTKTENAFHGLPNWTPRNSIRNSIADYSHGLNGLTGMKK